MKRAQKGAGAAGRPAGGRGEKEPEAAGGFNLGFLGVEGLLGGIERILTLAEKVEKAGGELRREGELEGPEGLRGVYGFRVRTALGGRQRPRVETFGNLRRDEERGGLKVSETREPLVDVFDEAEAVVVVAELPGVAEQDISVELSGRQLRLRSADGERKYDKTLTLPTDVDEARRTLQYTNGILKVTYPKKKRAGEGASKKV